MSCTSRRKELTPCLQPLTREHITIMSAGGAGMIGDVMSRQGIMIYPTCAGGNAVKHLRMPDSAV